jgi:hypothetical protein
LPTRLRRLPRLHPAALLPFLLIGLARSPGGSAAAAEQRVSGGPRQLLIAYRAAPADRPRFRSYLEHREAKRLEALRRQGSLAGYQILFNPFVQPRTWDAMVVLSFARFADTRRWLDIERSSPGGLDREGLALAKPVSEYSADLLWDSGPSGQDASEGHIFYVIPYTYLDSAAQYEAYVNGYVIPQLEGWIEAGTLSRYRIYLNRYPVGDPEPWDALFVYDYRSLEAFGRRDETLAAVRGRLRADPAWQKLSATKSSQRTEAENTIAEKLAGR